MLKRNCKSDSSHSDTLFSSNYFHHAGSLNSALAKHNIQHQHISPDSRDEPLSASPPLPATLMESLKLSSHMYLLIPKEDYSFHVVNA